MIHLRLIIPLLCFIFPLYSSLQTLMLEDLALAKYDVSIKYGPAERKKEHFDWNLEDEFEKAKNRILLGNLSTIKDYQKIFKDFLLTTRDYHVNASLYSTEWSFFPFIVKGVKDRYFLTNVTRPLELVGYEDLFDQEMVNENLLKENMQGIEVGDEILAINGIPVRQIIEQLIDENFGGDRSLTGYALAERALFFRRAKYGFIAPIGAFEITLTRNDKKGAFTRKLPWYHVSEWVVNTLLKYQTQKEAAFNGLNSKPLMQRNLKALLSKDFSVAIAKDLLFTYSNEGIHYAKCEGENLLKDDPEPEVEIDHRKKGFLPNLGELIWETEKTKHLYAYLYKNQDNKVIGYIYLPTFHYEDVDGGEIIQELIGIIQRFELESTALVFDITNNPGGELMFMYAVLSCLTDRPLKVTMHRELIIQQDVYNAAVIYNYLNSAKFEESKQTLSGYSIDAKVVQLLKQYATTIIRTWEVGQRITPLLFLNGIDEVSPDPQAQYTKPMIVLTNELDFSCGDFFPAILQDNNRAKIFGQRTAGAGGHVKKYNHTSRFGIQSFSLTASIAYRPNGSPVENLGVTPDIPYEISINDIRNEYQDYITTLNTELSRLSCSSYL